MSDRDVVLQGLGKALGRFEEFLATPAVTDRDRAGIIQGFEFSFELAWKAVQKYAAAAGSRFASPKQAFSFALREGLLSPNEEERCLQMLADRNLTVHTYQDEVAREVLARLPDYPPLLRRLLEALERAWS